MTDWQAEASNNSSTSRRSYQCITCQMRLVGPTQEVHQGRQQPVERIATVIVIRSSHHLFLPVSMSASSTLSHRMRMLVDRLFKEGLLTLSVIVVSPLLPLPSINYPEPLVHFLRSTPCR